MIIYIEPSLSVTFIRHFQTFFKPSIQYKPVTILVNIKKNSNEAGMNDFLCIGNSKNDHQMLLMNGLHDSFIQVHFYTFVI